MKNAVEIGGSFNRFFVVYLVAQVFESFKEKPIARIN